MQLSLIPEAAVQGTPPPTNRARELLECETQLQQAGHSTYQRGDALARIHDAELWRHQGYRSAVDYAQKKWLIGKAQFHRLIGFARQIKALNLPHGSVVPSAERVWRLVETLAPDDLEAKRKLLREASDRASGSGARDITRDGVLKAAVSLGMAVPSPAKKPGDRPPKPPSVHAVLRDIVDVHNELVRYSQLKPQAIKLLAVIKALEGIAKGESAGEVSRGPA